MEWLFDPNAWLALATLTVLEIVLGIDNIIFIAIIVEKLPEKDHEKARKIGLFMAMLMRVALLFALSFLMKLTEPLITVFSYSLSGRDLILFFGGIFLIAKSTLEIHEKMENHGESNKKNNKAHTFMSVLIQIMFLDIVFSLDSVITAIGMADHVQVMVIAVIISVIVMIIFVNSISNFINEHPTLKILALSFLLLIGFTLVGEGLQLHIPKGYIYFAMAFSVFIEFINMKIRNKKVSL